MARFGLRYFCIPEVISKYILLCASSRKSWLETNTKGWDPIYACWDALPKSSFQNKFRDSPKYPLCPNALYDCVGASWWGAASIPLCGGPFRKTLDYIAQRPPALPLASANVVGVPFFSYTAGRTSASVAAGAESQESGGCGAQIDNCVHWLSVPNSTSFIMLGSFVLEKEIMQWAAEEMELQKDRAHKKVWQIAMTGLGWSLVMEWN